MESDSVFDSEVADGAGISGLTENQAAETSADYVENDAENGQFEDNSLAMNGAPTSSSEAVEGEPLGEAAPVDDDQESAEAEAEGEEMDLDDTATSAADESAYIGDNCLSTPAATEDNSPEDGDLDSMSKAQEGLGEDNVAEGQEESPDQSISSAMPIDSAVGNSDSTPVTQDDESSTMDEDMGGEGVASSDDVNDISSAAHDLLSATGISSSTIEGGADISSSGQSEAALISSTGNQSAVLDSFSPPQPEANEFGDADTSEMDGAAAAPSVSESLPLLTMNANGSALLSTSLLPEESSGGGVSSSGGAESGETGAPGGEQAEGAEGAVSSSVGAAPLPPTDAAHALATLASAALHHQEKTEPEIKNEEDTWYTVGIIQGTSYTVRDYVSDPNLDMSSLTLDSLPELSGLPRTPLEPGTAYKFRIAAVNTCGRGEFGDESAFKTCLPGFPGAPSAIKISKSAEGAHLSWEPPQVAADGIFEYSVYLAVRSNTQPKESSKSQLAFVRVYCGKANTCVVGQSSLGAAHVDASAKPAIIFRIAARNEKGYGPATQVRWLQDIKSTGVKRPGDRSSVGASPSKQPKQLPALI